MDNNLPSEFDLIVVGTGVVESIISAAASRVGKRVLQVDSKGYYGGHWASFNLEDFENLKNDISEVEKNSYKTLGKDGESFLVFGNNLSKLPHFQTNWHISEDCADDQKPLINDKHEEKQIEAGIDSKNEAQCSTDKEVDNISKETEKLVVESKESKLTKESLRKDYRKFIIDLCPKLHFARGTFVELLISSNIARYAEFRSVSRVLTWINGNIEVVPCSRSDVFANNKVSVVEKRMLMKLLTSIEDDEKNLVVPAETTYKSLLKSKKLSENIIHFVLYALSMSTDETLWLDGLKGTKRFLHSLGRFGKTPFLFSMYGTGEITQAFCRLSAVFGGIFALNQPLHGFFTNSDNIFQALICGDQRIAANHLVMNVGMVPPQFIEEQEVKLISRSVIITDKSIMGSEREHLTLLLYPLKSNKLCRIIELGTLTGTCPRDLFLVHLTAPGTSNPREDLQECVENLFTSESDGESKNKKPRVLWSCYFSIPDTNVQKLKNTIPQNVFVCPGPDYDLDYDSSVQKAKEIFSSIYPNEEFLPRAPDAEEIVIEGEPEAASEAGVSSVNNAISVEVEEGVEQKMEEPTFTEVAVEAEASNSESNVLEDDGKHAELEECSEVKEMSD